MREKNPEEDRRLGREAGAKRLQLLRSKRPMAA